MRSQEGNKGGEQTKLKVEELVSKIRDLINYTHAQRTPTITRSKIKPGKERTWR